MFSLVNKFKLLILFFQQTSIRFLTRLSEEIEIIAGAWNDQQLPTGCWGGG